MAASDGAIIVACLNSLVYGRGCGVLVGFLSRVRCNSDDTGLLEKIRGCSSDLVAYCLSSDVDGLV